MIVRTNPGVALVASILLSLLVADAVAAQEPDRDADTVQTGEASAEGHAARGAPAGEADTREVSAALRPGPGSLSALPATAELARFIAEELPRADAPALLQPRPRGAVPLMAAGGTLLLAGAIIGGDAGTLVMVGGAGILAWGVYLYF
jgi:hypothetical protein